MFIIEGAVATYGVSEVALIIVAEPVARVACDEREESAVDQLLLRKR